MLTQPLTETNTRDRTALLTKLSNDLRVFDSFAEILQKCKASGYIDTLYDPLLKIFQGEAEFISDRKLTRTWKSTSKAKSNRPPEHGRGESTYLS